MTQRAAYVLFWVLALTGCARSDLWLVSQCAAGFHPEGVRCIGIFTDEPGSSHHFTGLSGGANGALAWGDFGSPTSTQPDGRSDLLTGPARNDGQTDHARVYWRTGASFSDSDLVASQIEVEMGVTSACIAPWGTDQRVEAFALGGRDDADRIYQWDNATYVDLATVNPGLEGNPNTQETRSVAFLDYDLDGDVDFFRLQNNEQLPADNELWTNVGAPSGLWQLERRGSRDETAADGGPSRRGLVIADLDLDGRPDIFVAGQEAVLYLNRSTVRDQPSFVPFLDTTGAAFDFNPSDDLGHTMRHQAPTVLDYDNDGDLDLYITAWDHGPNRLFENQALPGGSFALRDVTDETLAVLGPSATHKTAGYPGDFDNDGDLDLFVTGARADSAGGPNFLLRNELVSVSGTSRPPRFSEVTPESMRLADANSYGATWIDYDDDGDLDLMVANAFHSDVPLVGIVLFKNRYYENGGQHRYYRARVRLDGRQNPIGTKVEIVFGGHRQVREIVPVLGFGSAPGPDLHFGVGEHETIDEVRLYAPGDTTPTRVLSRVPTTNAPGAVDVVDFQH